MDRETELRIAEEMERCARLLRQEDSPEVLRKNVRERAILGCELVIREFQKHKMELIALN